MQPFYQDKHRTLYNSDCRSMPELEDNSIQCVVTSPPYWGLRKYSGNQDLIWGGNPECNHQWLSETRAGMSGGTNEKSIGGWTGGSTGKNTVFDKVTTNTCRICGAWRGAYGLEPTPEMYVQHTIEILTEIHRVLRKDGVVFWNIGDSYIGGNSGSRDSNRWPKQSRNDHKCGKPKRPAGLKNKDLSLIPFRVAIAVQEAGWWVRSIIIWDKPNPMPESVKDRPTESHEYIIMLTKSSKYYWDIDAVREKSKDPDDDLRRIKQAKEKNNGKGNSATKDMSYLETWSIGEPAINANGRNLRSVWTFPTQPYPEAHFATFPEKLPELCIKAATKENDIVLDPFSGAGTTLKVAAELNRRSVGYELSEEYCQLIIDRNKQQVLC